MKLSGEVTAVELQDAKFFVSLNWGDFDRIASALDASPSNIASVRIITNELPGIVNRVEGLTDADGTPVTALTAEVLAQMAPAIVLELWTAITSLGLDVRQTSVPLVEPSEEKPEPS